MHTLDPHLFDHKIRNILTNVSLSLQSPARITQPEQAELAEQVAILSLLLGHQDLLLRGELPLFIQPLEAGEVLSLVAETHSLTPLLPLPAVELRIKTDRQQLVIALDLLLRWAETAGLASGEFDTKKRTWRLELAAELAPLPAEWQPAVEAVTAEPTRFFGLLGSAILARLGGSTAANGKQLAIVLPGA